jgi:hypothetical protein
MKTLLLILSSLLASAAFGSDDANVFSCMAGASPNGLGVERIALDLSKEDPEGVMTITYINAKQTAVGHITYDGDLTHYEIFPASTKNLGHVSVDLVKNNGKWTATMKKESIDNFSVLDCEEI